MVSAEVKQIMANWEKLTSLTLETEEFTEFYQLAINDYFGITPEYEKTKNLNDIKKKGFCSMSECYLECVVVIY